MFISVCKYVFAFIYCFEIVIKEVFCETFLLIYSFFLFFFFRPKKICLYSTHDSLIIGLLEAFGLRDDSWPPFAADVTLELYEDENQQFWVQVKYCGKVLSTSL